MTADCAHCVTLQRQITDLEAELDAYRQRDREELAGLDAEARHAGWGLALDLHRAAELRLLAYFLRHPGHAVHRAALMEVAGFADSDENPRTVDVYICRLRKALDAVGLAGVIQTIWAHGYRMTAASGRRVREVLAARAEAA